MNYEFYDRDGNLLGLSEKPEGQAIANDETFIHQFEGHTAVWWRAVDVEVLYSDLLRVIVVPGSTPISR